jgi:hypothetical protein
MKKRNRLVLSAALAVCFVLTVVSTAFASDSVPDPTARSYVNGLNYAYEIVGTSDLPGVINDGTSKILPVGLSDTKQFEGNGIKIFDITTDDKVTICFALPNYQYGWTGKIYRWYGGKWISYPSTLMEPNGEGGMYHVCTPYAGNGTYALLVSYSAK